MLTYVTVKLVHKWIIQKLSRKRNVSLDCFRFGDRIIRRFLVEPIHLSESLNEFIFYVVHYVDGGLLRFGIEMMLHVNATQANTELFEEQRLDLDCKREPFPPN